MTFDRIRFTRSADILAVALVVSLPWSTSATGIFAGLWLLSFVSTFDPSSLRRPAAFAAAGLPVALVMLGAAGMLWADVPWADRFDGFGSFFKLTYIPLLMHQFRFRGSGRPVLIGFLASSVALLAVSWALLAWPGMPWPGSVKTLGVPLHDYIAQSATFTFCIFVVLQLAYDYWRDARRRLALALAMLALIFIANIFYVATSRTSLIVIPILLAVFGYRLAGWKGGVASAFGFLVLVAAAWPSATFLRLRVTPLYEEIRSYEPGGSVTSAGERLEFWRKSVEFMREAPVFGHGTGSIREQFRRAAVGQTGMAAEVSSNPHNQILAVGIQIGLVGVVVLVAMWLAHLALFRSMSLAAWVGLVVVIQNIVGSLFNSHLFDFTLGWGYVLGVGIAGGIVLKKSATRQSASTESINR